MADVTTAIQGETVPFRLQDNDYTSVKFRLGSGVYDMTFSDLDWSVEIDTSALAGRYRWAMIADGRAVASGVLAVRPLVSKYAAVVEAIDAAMQKNATNGKYSITVGEISLTDKTFAEMMAARAYYAGLAEAEETGEVVSAASMPTFTTGEYHGVS